MAARRRFVTGLGAVSLVIGVLTGMPAPAGADGRINVQVSVLARALLDAQRSPRQVVISQEDLARGYHDVAQPVEVDFRSNHPNGVVLAFASSSGFLEAIEAFEAGMPLSAGASVYVPQRERGFRARRVSVKLRLKLGPDALPGAVSFPITVSLAPSK